MHKSTWRGAARLLRGIFGLGLLAAATLGQAQIVGNNQIRLLVGFPAGGGTDVIARILAEKLNDELGTTVVVDNRAGAGGQIAAQLLKQSPADGHTFFLSHDRTISILPQVIKNPGFNPEHDFVPVAGFATFANVLAVSGGTPAKNFNEYIAWVRKDRGGKDTIGIPAPASIPEFLVKLIGAKYKLDLQAAPYRGSAPMMSDMLGNQISAGIAGVPDFIENQKAGRVRIVAVIGDKRQPLVPQAPTFAELGLTGLEDLPYYGIFAPVGTPKPMIDKFDSALEKVLKMPDVRQRLTALGLTVEYMPQGQFAGRVRSYTATWAQIIKSSGYQAQ